MKKSLFLVLAAIGLVITGCGAGPQEVDKNYVEKSTENAKLARQLFDQTGGKWESVSAADKKKLTEAYGSDKAVQTVWTSMGAPPVGGMAPNTAPK